MDYSSIARRAFSVQPLPSGALPVYDVGGESYYLGEDGQQVFSTSRPRLAVPMFEIASNPQIPLSAIRERRFELIDRAQNLALQDLNGAEENGAFSILERATLNNIMQADVTPESLAELFSSIERNDLRVARLFMNPWGYADMRRRIGGSGHLDIETSRELMDVGLMGTSFGAQVIVSSAVPVGSIYATSDPEFVGVIPVRMDITALSADNPEQQTLGWSVFEEIGMACTNPRSMARLTFPTEFVEPVVEEPVIVIPRMDRYALLRSLTNDDL
jgi:hypothetical protein